MMIKIIHQEAKQIKINVSTAKKIIDIIHWYNVVLEEYSFF
jgi:hypothetical protein